jgi:glutathione S-transferase
MTQSPSLTIHGVAASRTSRVLWLVHELGLAHTHDPVPFGDAGTRSPAFLAVNPNGQIPAISDGDLVLWESLAINLYLAKKHGGPLAPASLAEDGLMTMWSFWVMGECEPVALDVFYHRVLLPAEKRDEALVAAGLAKLEKPLAVLDAALAKGNGHLVGGRFTVADLNVAAVLSYLRGAPEALANRPHVSSWLSLALARPAHAAVMKMRHAS